MKPLVVDLALGESWRASQTMVPEPDQPALEPAVQHRPAGEHDGRDVHRGGAHQAGAACVLSQPVVSTTPSSG